MKVIPPISTVAPWCILPSMLTSSTEAEPGAGETAWVSGTTYAVDDVRVYTTDHRKYKRLVAGAGTTAPNLDTTNWEDSGPSNKWAMFDVYRNTATVATSPLTVVITPGKRVSALALVGMVAESVTVTMTSGGSTVYSYTEDLILRHTTTWYEYFFGEFAYQPSLIRFDLPPYANGIITITLTSASAPVQCGAIVVGTAVYIGQAQHGATSDSLNFSTITREADGTATLVPRRTIPKTNQTLLIDKGAVNKAREVKNLLNAVPAVWAGIADSGDGYFESLLILGIYKEFTFNLAQPSAATIALQLEEI